jgi:ATP-dependent Lon protease
MSIQEIEIPREVPVMVMSQVTLFPQAMMPLFIFEPRYREMLANVLEQDRIFALAGLDEREEDAEIFETPCPIAGVGVVRACKQQADGTSKLILQGLARVEFESFVCEEPYRRARIHQVMSESDVAENALPRMQPTLLSLVQTQIRLGADIPQEVMKFLSNIKEPENALDLAIYTLCPSGRFKQELLETRSILTRFNKFVAALRAQIEGLKLDHKLRGGLDDDHVGNN